MISVMLRTGLKQKTYHKVRQRRYRLLSLLLSLEPHLHNNVSVHNTTELKIVKMVNFRLCIILPQFIFFKCLLCFQILIESLSVMRTMLSTTNVVYTLPSACPGSLKDHLQQLLCEILLDNLDVISKAERKTDTISITPYMTSYSLCFGYHRNLLISTSYQISAIGSVQEPDSR